MTGLKTLPLRRSSHPALSFAPWAGVAVLLLAGAALPAPGALSAQPVPDDISTPMTIHRLTGPIELDGVVDEAAWDDVAPLPMTMFTPTFGGGLTERTEVRVAHDDQYLYVSGRMFDSDPDGIRTNTFYRDIYSGDDLLAVIIDSYNDYETAVWFVVNPAGTRNDRSVSNDAVFGGGGMPMNSDWNAHWDVVTSRSGEGWFAEMRIPFSTLGFQTVGGEVVMGLISYRFIARKNERQLFPGIDPKWGGLAFAKPSQSQRVVLRDVRQSTPVYVTPYGLAGIQRTPTLVEAGGPPRWEFGSDPTREVGADLRVSPVSNLTLDLTANTDFAQVEADDQQINLTRFPLFFPEKRQFFQERSSTFQFNTGGSNSRLFHSRRIGLDDGQIVRIYGGARAVGRVGGTDFGLLSMQTAEHDGRPGENMSVARMSQKVFNPFSSVGAMVTSRLGSSGQDNVAYGVDASIRVVGDEYLTVKWAQTFDEAVDEASAWSSGLLQARWERQTDEGLSYSGEYLRVGDEYLPRLGFQTRDDFDYVGGSAQYKRFRDADSPLRSIGLQVTTGHYYRGADGSAESRSVKPELSMEFKNNAELSFNLTSSYESVPEAFSVAGAPVDPGDYWFHVGQARFQLSRNALFRGDVTVTGGSFYDGTRLGVALKPTWNQSRYLELTGGYEVNRLEFGDRGVATTAHLGSLKAQFALNTQVFFSVLAQYSNAADLTTVNARFRYNFREGTDLWLVYNEGLNTEREVTDRPRLPVSAGRTLMLKYSHAFIW